MNASSPFDRDSLMYKLMKYLYKMEDQMQSVGIVWYVVDVIQFLTIIVALLGRVIKTQYFQQGKALFGNFVNVFFNYSTIYVWVVISGAVSAIIIILGLIVYLIIECRKGVRKQIKLKILTYCAVTGTFSIALVQFFFQVLTNNMINIFSGIMNKNQQMGILFIMFFVLNLLMMLFVSIFNSQNRIFRFSLVLVSLVLNTLPFTLACLLIILLAIYYQQTDRVTYKVISQRNNLQKVFYYLIIVTCVWCGLQMNQTTKYFLPSRFIYLGISWIAIVLYYLHFKRDFMSESRIDQNRYLVYLYKRKVKKQDKKQDYMLADQYFTKYYQKEYEEQQSVAVDVDEEMDSHLIDCVEQWQEGEYRERLIEKIRADRAESVNLLLSKGQMSYFENLLQLKVNMVSLLKEVFEFMSEKKNDNIQLIYQINKLTTKIEKQFTKQSIANQESVLKIDSIVHLEELYQQFYSRYVYIVELLQDIFDSLEAYNGQLTQNTEEKLYKFTQEQKLLQKTLYQIQKITGNKLQTKLYNILSRIWDSHQLNSKIYSSFQLQNPSNLPSPQLTQKFEFSYIVTSNRTIKYASIKFLSTYSYKESHIVGQNLSIIFPNKFSLFVLQLLDKNADKKVFHSQIPIINQRGNFQIVNSTFYLLPEFKGQITYIIMFKKIPQMEMKSLFIFNTETLCIEGFNKRIVTRFKFSPDKINLALQNGAIQFSNLFVFNNQDKDFLTFTKKSSLAHTSKMSRKVFQSYDKTIKQSERASCMKALIKMDYLSDLKKSTAKNVNLQTQISFQISNICFKVIKVDDNSNQKFTDNSMPGQITQEIQLFKQNTTNGPNSLQKTTKDLKKKYQSQQFFCPIPNPLLPKITEQLNLFNSSGRFNNSLLIKIFFVLGLVIFTASMLGLNISANNFQKSILEFERQADSLNDQYSYFMEGILYAYRIHHMQILPQEFKKYVSEWKQISDEEAQEFNKNEIKYLYEYKSKVIKQYQSAYFDFPILQDTESVDVKIMTGTFTLEGSSKSTLSYDLVVFLLDSSAPPIKEIISQNFQLYRTFIKILRPDGRYDDKIRQLQQQPSLISLIGGTMVVLFTVIIYYWLHQLRETKEEVIMIYRYIQKKEIVESKRKVSEVQDLIQILSNNKKSSLRENASQAQTRNDQFSTLSELNSANNINSDLRLPLADSVRSFDDESQQLENQNQMLIQAQNQPNISIKKNQQRDKITQTSKRAAIFIETVLKYPFYLLILILNMGVFYYFYTFAIDASDSYVKAFEYFEKLRASNFQFRFLYAKSQQLAYYESVTGKPYVDPYPLSESEKKTHFDYEKPAGFRFSNDDSLCSSQVLANMTDPWFMDYDCREVDSQILTRQFSQAYEQYERNLRVISNSTYQQLISDASVRQLYFYSMYQYNIFKNYLTQLLQVNFQSNLTQMGAAAKQNFKLLFNFVLLWVFISIIFTFVFTFPKLEAEISTIISLIKMIPSETLFNMKVASFIKKRNLLSKFTRL